MCIFFFFSSRRRHTRLQGDWSSDVCSSDLVDDQGVRGTPAQITVRRDGEVLERRTVTPGNTINAQIPIAHAGPNIVEIEAARSEERRVGKECRHGGAQDRVKKKEREEWKKK